MEMALVMVLESVLGLGLVPEMAMVLVMVMELVPVQHRRRPRLLPMRKLRLIKSLSFSLTCLLAISNLSG
jgi:hypothetical protein